MKGRCTVKMRHIMILGLAMALAAANAAEPLAKLKIEKVDVTAYGELTAAPDETGKRGVLETLYEDGKVFLSVDAYLVPKWTEQTKKASIEKDEIALAGKSGECPKIGRMEYGFLRNWTSGFSAWRPYNWQKMEPEAQRYNIVFLVPKVDRLLALRLGNLTTKIRMPLKIMPPPNPARGVHIEVGEARFVDDVQSEFRQGELKMATTLTNPNGRLLEVKVRLTPLAANDNSGARFFWYTPWMGLLRADGGFTPAAGERFRENISSGVSHNMDRKREGTWATEESTLYFAVPANVKSFTLTYLLTPVAKGKVSR